MERTIIRCLLGTFLTLGVGLQVACKSSSQQSQDARKAGNYSRYEGDTLHLASLTIEPRRVSLLWELRAEDCLTCFTPSVAMRKAQRAFGAQVGLIFAIIKGDSAVVAE